MDSMVACSLVVWVLSRRKQAMTNVATRKPLNCAPVEMVEVNLHQASDAVKAALARQCRCAVPIEVDTPTQISVRPRSAGQPSLPSALSSRCVWCCIPWPAARASRWCLNRRLYARHRGVRSECARCCDRGCLVRRTEPAANGACFR